jgi:hypothetical protein
MNGKLIFNLVFVGLALAVGIALGMRPWPVYQEQRKNAESLRSEALKSESDRVELERQRNKYETSLGREELARKGGYKKAGESDANLGD